MHKSIECAVLLMGVSGCAVAADEGQGGASENVAPTQAAVVRGTAISSRPQVVMLHIIRSNNTVQPCSASYFAPRVLVTDAVCLRSSPTSVFVYFGTDYNRDKAALPNIPAPGQVSVWAKADSWETHPSYNAAKHDASLAVVYLDRKLPFDPLPLARFNIGSSYVGQQVEFVGWGASKALSADIQQFEGLGVKRKATVSIAGTPTAADYHADDPNPGLLDPLVRSHYVKLNGHSPYGNACMGDAGAPFIINQWGQDYLGGASLWTGLWCEDYQMATRFDPYLPFLDNAYMKGGQATVIPRLECVSQEAGNSLRAHFGYNNKNGVNVTVPYGAANSFAQDTKNVRPSLFLNGDHGWDSSIDIPAGKQLYWKLSPANSPTTELRVDATSPRCTGNDRHLKCERYCRPQLAVPACPASSTRSTQEQCIDSCYDAYGYLDEVGCSAQYDAAIACVAGTSTDAANWQCFDDYPDPIPADFVCADSFNALNACLGY